MQRYSLFRKYSQKSEFFLSIEQTCGDLDANDNLNDNLLADARYYSSLQKRTEKTEKLQKLARLRQAPPATVRCAYDDRLAVCSCDEQNPPSTSFFRHIVLHCVSKKHIPFYIHFSFLWKYANGQRVHIVNTWW